MLDVKKQWTGTSLIANLLSFLGKIDLGLETVIKIFSREKFKKKQINLQKIPMKKLTGF